MSLTARIFIGLIAGMLFGIFVMPSGLLPGWGIDGVKFLGALFLKLLKMVVVPLILASILLAVARMGDLKKLGRLGLKTFLFYMVTTAMASITGLILVNLMRPGVGSTIILEGDVNLPEAQSIWDILLTLIPSNPVSAMTNFELPAVIFFALFFGSLLSQTLPKGQIVIDCFEVINDVMFKMVNAIMKVAPFGVFGLLAGVMYDTVISSMEQSGQTGIVAALYEFFVPIFYFYITVILALAIHSLGTLPLILKVFGRTSVTAYFKSMGPALIMAFSSSSSAATMPLTLKGVTGAGEVRKTTANFVIPIGATMNMDGTAIYLGIAALFIAQVVGLPLGLPQQMLIFLTAMIASVGAAGIPSGSLILMVIIFEAVGLPMAGVGLLLAVDRILDMSRTMTNVWGDAVGAKVVDVLEGHNPKLE